MRLGKYCEEEGEDGEEGELRRLPLLKRGLSFTSPPSSSGSTIYICRFVLLVVGEFCVRKIWAY